MPPLSISKAVARRYVLGRQGLWPGRRWAGQTGTAQALRYVEAVQMDPLNVVARSHDLVLWGRVIDYEPGHLHRLLYHDRAFFDYGGALFVYPMDELPYWQVIMRRKGAETRWATFVALARGLTRFARFLAARRLDLSALHPIPLREQVQAQISLANEA